MEDSLRRKTITGMIWSAIQRVGTLTISFLSSLVLARLLSPDDFGYIGMLMVFVALAETLIDGGFRSALIQKKAPTNADYSTILYFNLMISSGIYVVLFFAAPLIASFYRLEQLCVLLRVMGILVVLYALGIVQGTQLQKRLNFAKLAAINLVSAVISTAIGILLAFHGFGVWSLAIRSLLSAALNTLLYWLSSRWKPSRGFSLESFKELFSFGGLILLANFTETLALQLVSLFIGRIYSSRDLGYYTQAKNLHKVPETAIPFLTNQVLFPVFSSMQDNVSKVVDASKRSLKALTYLSFPTMIVLAIIAKPLVVILFTDKWLESIPYFQLLCFGGMLYSVNSCNVTVLKAMGRGKSILYVSIIKRIVTLLSVVAGVRFGIYGIVLGSILSIYSWFPINAYTVGRLTGYGTLRQLRDIGPNFVMSIGVGCIVFFGFTLLTVNSNFVIIALEVLSYLVLYVASSYLMNDETFHMYVSISKSFLTGVRKRRGRN